jgi:transposase
MTFRDFQERFPTEEACMDYLMTIRYGQRVRCSSCDQKATYYRVSKRRCYECGHCGHQVYPTAGTPLEHTRTSVWNWFYVMFLFTLSPSGVTAREVQHQLGVNYTTAWRMCKKIRKHMATNG